MNYTKTILYLAGITLFFGNLQTAAMFNHNETRSHSPSSKITHEEFYISPSILHLAASHESRATTEPLQTRPSTRSISRTPSSQLTTSPAAIHALEWATRTLDNERYEALKKERAKNPIIIIECRRVSPPQLPNISEEANALPQFIAQPIKTETIKRPAPKRAPNKYVAQEKINKTSIEHITSTQAQSCTCVIL